MRNVFIYVEAITHSTVLQSVPSNSREALLILSLTNAALLGRGFLPKLDFFIVFFYISLISPEGNYIQRLARSMPVNEPKKMGARARSAAQTH